MIPRFFVSANYIHYIMYMIVTNYNRDTEQMTLVALITKNINTAKAYNKAINSTSQPTIPKKIGTTLEMLPYMKQEILKTLHSHRSPVIYASLIV